MSQQLGTSRNSVAAAAAFLAVSLVAFAATFYVLDGRSRVKPLLETLSAYVSDLSGQDTARTPEEVPIVQGLVLPEGMSEQFALRVWQEQVDSQGMIRRLVKDEVASLAIKKVEIRDDVASLRVLVRLRDGSEGPGEIRLRRFESDWYLSLATGMRSSEATGMAAVLRSSGARGATATALPAKEDVDSALLSTLFQEQKKCQSIIAEYLDGTVREVVVTDVVTGPGTATVELLMKETHGTAVGKLVAIRSGDSSQPIWFIARFAKIRSDHGDRK